jgi:hypothetical protein
VFRVRERFEAVETPLKRTKKSRNARQKLFFSDTGALLHSLLDSSAVLRDARGLQMCRDFRANYELDFGPGFLVAACFALGLETPMLISRKPSPLRSISSNRMMPSPRPAC